MRKTRTTEEELAAISPNISVVIPHLNQAVHLRRCLQALAGQSYPRQQFEIIVVDNGSRELPVDIVGSYENARIEQEQIPGPGPARNRGVAAAQGNILAFIDADCIADKEWLATIAAKFQAPKKRILGGDVRIDVVNPERLTQLEAYESVFAYRQQEYIEKQGFSGTGNLAFRREDFDAIGPFAGIEIAEDRDWGHRATKLGYIIEYVPEMVVYHPARDTFADLFEKWARHIDHDFSEYTNLRFGALRWTMYAAAVVASPVLELRRIFNSTRISTLRQRRLAATALIRVRLYRAKHMTTLLLMQRSNRRAQSWNRD